MHALICKLDLSGPGPTPGHLEPGFQRALPSDPGDFSPGTSQHDNERCVHNVVLSLLILAFNYLIMSSTVIVILSTLLPLLPLLCYYILP